MYQSPVNCWVNFPLTLVLWFITLLQIWHCQSKCSGRAFAGCPGFLFCHVRNQLVHNSSRRKEKDATMLGFLHLSILFIYFLDDFNLLFSEWYSVCLKCSYVLQNEMKLNSESHELILLLTSCVFCVLVVCLPVSFSWIWETGILRGSLVISSQQTLDALHTVT